MSDKLQAYLDEKFSEISQHVANLQAELHSGPRRWLSVPEAAAYASISERSIRWLFSAGKLHPHRPVKGRTLVDRHELDAVLESSTGKVRTGRGLHSHHARSI